MLKLFSKSIFISAALFITIHTASANTSFTFSVPEGQGASNNEFYHGRCVRVDVMLDTDGHNTGGADLEINYNSSRIAIVNNNCSTAATTIYHDSQYQNYTNNHVVPGTGKITLGAYNNPGVPYNGSGRFASFYFTVLDGAGDYDLDFEATPGVTTDSNLAEYGTGNDILDDANSYTLHFADDNDTPYINNLNPASSATGVSVVSNILYRLNDDDAGVNFSTLTQSLTGTNWGTTNYTASSGQISHSCHSTNTNRVPYCDTTLNPTNNLYYCETYTVVDSISDLGNPTVHSLNNYTYTFDTEDDNDAPELYNLNPGDGAGGVSTTSNITFDIRDVANPGGYPGTGVDISTLSINVSAPGWGSQTYTTASPELTTTPAGVNDYGHNYIYNISVNPATDFPENTLITVTVDVDDYGCPTINSRHQVYTFTTADTIGPVCTLFTPAQNVVNMGTADNVTFHCTDSGVGVDINTVRAVVDSTIYTATGANQFTYTGTSADYFITVNPASDFVIEYALEVIVNARDFSGNASDQVSFGLATGVNGSSITCPPCETCEECEKCEDKTKTKTKTIIEYQQCAPIQKIKETSGLIKSKISNTQIDKITLREINDVDIKIGNATNNLLTSIVGGEKQVLVTVYDDIVIFEGTALPNSQITLMIESTPIIVTGIVDDDGNWRIETANIFTNGMHKVSAITMSEDNYIMNTKFLANFRVQRSLFNWWCLLIIVILLILLIMTYKKYKEIKRAFCDGKLTNVEKDKLNKKYCFRKKSKKIIRKKRVRKIVKKK